MRVICLDPGHGGADNGVVRGNEWERLVEKDYVLKLGLLLAPRISTLPGCFPILTRDEDVNLELDEAGKEAADRDADLALCLHVNASPDVHHRGLMAFYMEADTKGRAVADAIASSAPRELRRRHGAGTFAEESAWPSVRNVLAPFRKRNISAVLVECGFASNNADRAFLQTQAGIHSVANAIEAGVIEFLVRKQEESKHAA